MPARIEEDKRRAIWEDFCRYLPAKEGEAGSATSGQVGYRQALVLVAEAHGVGPATVSRIVRSFRSKPSDEPTVQESPIPEEDLPAGLVDAVEHWIREDPSVRWPELEARARSDFGVRSARKRLQRALLQRGVRKRELLSELRQQRAAEPGAAKPTTGFREVHRRKPEKKNGRRGYPSDMTSAEWPRVQAQLQDLCLTYRSKKFALRDLIDAVRYQQRSGCAWRMLPNDFPPNKAVYNFFQAWTRNGTWQKLQEGLGFDLRTSNEPHKSSRTPHPTRKAPVGGRRGVSPSGDGEDRA